MFCAAVKAESTQDKQTTTSVKAETALSETEPKTAEEAEREMFERSLTSIVNPSRIKAKIEQARSGEKTVVAYIGGSITEGYAGGPEGCYAKLSYDYFAGEYGTGDNVEYVNAGLSGTASMVIAEYDEPQDMEIELRPADDETGEKTFTLFGFAVCE